MKSLPKLLIGISFSNHFTMAFIANKIIRIMINFNIFSIYFSFLLDYYQLWCFSLLKTQFKAMQFLQEYEGQK